MKLSEIRSIFNLEKANILIAATRYSTTAPEGDAVTLYESRHFNIIHTFYPDEIRHKNYYSCVYSKSNIEYINETDEIVHRNVVRLRIRSKDLDVLFRYIELLKVNKRYE